MYWEVGKYVGSVLLGSERAEYGKKNCCDVITTIG
jgi:hypothetical protein